MQTENLPLFKIFTKLREEYRFSLGVEEYVVIIDFLKAGVELNSCRELEELCCLAWAKSIGESAIVRQLFAEHWLRLTTLPTSNADSRSMRDVSLEEKRHESVIDDSPLLDNEFDESLNIDSEETSLDNDSELVKGSSSEDYSNIDVTFESLQPVEIAQSYRRRERVRKRSQFALLKEYFPVTKRQMSQSWRHLRRYVRQGIATELDVAATVQKIGRQGVIGEPVLLPPRINQASVMLLIDQNGSMMPFHSLSRQLADTAKQGAQFKGVDIFYFHNCPDNYLYEHPSLSRPQLLKDVLTNAAKGVATLIVSDAGAARGAYNDDRVQFTEEWIEELRECVQNIAWINPMPLSAWKGTTAETIARMVPMFEMSRVGMNLAIDVLRGRYLAVKRVYSWLK